MSRLQAPGVYQSSLQGCCRVWTQLQNNRGIGWDVVSNVRVSPGWTPNTRTNDNTLASPYVPMIPRTRGILGTKTQFYTKAFDLYGRSRAAQDCTAHSSSGCRFTYRLAMNGEGGLNYTSSAPSAALPASVSDVSCFGACLRTCVNFLNL